MVLHERAIARSLSMVFEKLWFGMKLAEDGAAEVEEVVTSSLEVLALLAWSPTTTSLSLPPMRTFTSTCRRLLAPESPSMPVGGRIDPDLREISFRRPMQLSHRPHCSFLLRRVHDARSRPV